MADSHRLGTKRTDCYSSIPTNINETSGLCIMKEVIVWSSHACEQDAQCINDFKLKKKKKKNACLKCVYRNTPDNQHT